MGNLTSVTDPTGTTSFTYFDNHLLKRITYPTGLFLEYTYDSLGRRTSMTDQDGREITYVYTPFGRLESISETGRGQVAHYAYDEKHRLKTKTLGNGVTTSYAYDIAGCLDLLTNYTSEGVILSKFDYTFDTMGRRTAMETRDGKWDYGYDKTGQLVSAQFTSTNPDIPDRNISYSYDAAGNRTETVTDGSTESYTTNSLNQYDQAGDTHFTYDADGNLVTRTTSAGTTTYTYNDDNRLTSVSGPDGLTQYQYDGLGNLTSIVKNGTTTHYLIDPAGYGNVVGEYDDTGSLITGYTHGMGLVAKDNHYFTFDGSGNTSELTDTGTAAVNTYVYDPFGKVFHSTGTAENEFQFVGQFGIRQAGDDLVYMRNRFYMPGTGRFMNPDPIGMAGGINLYAYTENDPVNYINPNGLIWVTVGRDLRGPNGTKNIRKGAFNWLMGKIGSGWSDGIPMSTAKEYEGMESYLIQEWQEDWDNPHKDKKHPIGTKRIIRQKFLPKSSPKPGEYFYTDPKTTHQWTPIVPNYTYQEQCYF